MNSIERDIYDYAIKTLVLHRYRGSWHKDDENDTAVELFELLKGALIRALINYKHATAAIAECNDHRDRGTLITNAMAKCQNKEVEEIVRTMVATHQDLSWLSKPYV